MLHLVTTIDYSKYQYKSSCCTPIIRVVVRLLKVIVTAPANSPEVRSNYLMVRCSELIAHLCVGEITLRPGTYLYKMYRRVMGNQ